MTKYHLTADTLTSYGKYLQQEERSPATVEKYMRDLRGFSAWLEGRAVTKRLAAGWKQELLDQGLSPATVNAKLSALNGLFRFLKWEDFRVRFLKLQRRVFRDTARDLGREDYSRLLDAAKQLGREQLALIIETICATGIRVSEVRYITVEAVRAQRADVSLKGKIRTILLPKKLCRKLAKFAQKEKIASGEIFLTRRGTGVSRCAIWREMKALCAKAGVAPSKVFPHNVRHLFATAFYRATRDIVKLADLLGHSSINPPRIYLLATGTEHARQLELLRLVI